ncbi:MAG: recombinase family protein [Subdoligranulum sp.]
MPQVQVIQPIQQQPKRLRVAAYARVSSDSTDQLNSLSVQVDYYTHLIQENPNWDFAGIYADEGITGTSTKHREQFNRLLDDCRAGLIDRVLVKSASRFARNTADALASVREMKSLGVTVVFEKEGFDTETANGEMILSMICATAQEESLSISQNTKWGIRKKMHDGTYITSLTPFGYKKINRQLFPDEKEAATVKEIFNLFLNGFSTAEIANHLNTNHPKPDVIWRSASVRFILRNEKYIGDSLFQKNYTPDTLPLKSCCNTGQLPKYYVEGTHPGIISKDEFERVQSLLTQKNINSTNSRACILSKVVFCALCGHVCSRKVRKSQTFVWCCRTHLQSAALCPLKPVSETEIQQAFLSVYNKLQANQSYILQPIIDTLLQLRFLQEQANSARQTARDDVQRLAKQRHNLTRIHTLGSKKNTGQLPQYYIENNHEGIVTKQTFREAQAEIARRNSKSATNHRKRHRGRYNSKYALSERLVCGDCGSSYKRVTWSIHGRKQIVWRCVNRLEYGTKFCSNSPSIPETELHQAILKAVQNLAAKFTGEVADQLNGILHQIEVGESLTPQLQAQLEQNQQEFDHLLEMSLDFDENTPFLDDKLKRLSDKIKQLKTAITQSSVNSQTPSTPTNPITAKDLLITEYDDMLTARIIEKIIVKSRQDLEIIFIGGYTQQISLQ